MSAFFLIQFFCTLHDIPAFRPLLLTERLSAILLTDWR
ncbi:hypothetical protein C7420_1016 [Pantoea ananatis]|nr:hypothetical protein C7427_1016 [Pantoea ananatis]RAR74415.1 hypothetical protein C7420_1016 [Pantoea ananatis]SKA81296.1 hypothetical protein SAMN03097719_3485 [Pantoea ananatis]